MCGSPDLYYLRPQNRARLSIKAIFLKLNVLKAHKPFFPKSLTLVFLPRISGEALEINDSIIRSQSSGLLTLHRFVSALAEEDAVTYGAMDRVQTGDALGFEVYFREDKLLKGVIRRNVARGWKMECRCQVDPMTEIEVSQAELQVEIEGYAPMREVVGILGRRKKRGRRFVQELADIPEEMEDGVELFCGGCLRDGEQEVVVEEMEAEIEPLKWAVDVGIWITCLSFGLGYLASKATFRACIPKKLL